ncbi:hypothetical protein POX44_15355 [Klebsiella quasipneumoniae]|uniref:hypothetical protein n=1 Tax=Klebsiella quasipneumoniae TaxID=1463165 RepID=UPI002FF69925
MVDRYNTGDSRPSNSMKNLSDNALAFDDFMNSENDTFIDRLENEKDTLAGAKKKMAAAAEASVQDARQNLIPLSRQYMTLAAAQADIANIPVGSTTYYRSPDDSALAIEVINNAGTLTATGRKMPSQQSIDLLQGDLSEINETVDKVVFDGEEDIYYSVVDSEGNVVGTVRRSPTGTAIVEYKNHALADQSIDGLFLQDQDGTIHFAAYGGEVFSGAGFSQRKYTITQSDEFSFLLADSEGNVSQAVDTTGKPLNVDSVNAETDAVLIASASSLSAAAGIAANTFRVSALQRPRKKINIYIIYGQSYSVGADSERVLSTQQMFGNLTLGTDPRGQNWWSTATQYTFSPTGGNVLSPLIETGVETPVSGLIDSLKWLHNESMGVEDDVAHLFAGAATGVSATSIAQLSEGADPERYNRLRTALSGFASAANAAGYDACVAGVIYIQGEADNNSTYDIYYAALQNLFNQINGTIKQYFPDNKDVDFFIGQMGGYFVVDTNNQAIPRAQMDFCDNNANAHFVGPYAMLPCPSSGYHLLANSYRWFYSNIAKAVHKVMKGYEQTTFRINSVRHSENALVVGFNVPFPPLRFRDAYIKQDAVMFDDKGFTVTDSVGVLKGTDLTVEIVAPTVIKITCSRQLSGDVRLTLADQENHTGRHNVSDSDPSVSIFKWETNTDTAAPDYIPALNGINYPLYNWAGIDSVLSKEA